MAEQVESYKREQLAQELDAIYDLFYDDAFQGEVTISFDGKSYSVNKADLQNIVTDHDFAIFMVLLQDGTLGETEKVENELAKFIQELHNSFRDLESSQKEG